MIEINKCCRICKSSNLTEVIHLGKQALTGVFVKDGSSVEKFNMSLSICDDCGLVQINEVYDLDLLYGDGYGYESSLNSSMIEHLKAKAEKHIKDLNIKKNDVIIDIGSNDATTLSFFDEECVRIGVDFTGSKFKEKYEKIGAILVPHFFPPPTLDEVLNSGKAKLISSYSCFYDLPDPVNFAKKVHDCLADDGIWCLEQSYMPSMLETNSFDTICHEHIEYYKLQDIKNICDKANLELKDVSFNNINGGSFSVNVGHKNGIIAQKNICQEILNEENKIDWREEYINFNNRINEIGDRLVKKLTTLKNQGKRVAGIGSSTKGNVLLQYYGIDSNLIESIGEVNPNKYGCSTPGSNIPIVSEKDLLDSNPDYLLVLPWHFKDFFMSNIAFSGHNIIFPLPDIDVIERK